ncbi:PREDICTED: uncharacterized protein LOC109157275 [Ipomoea nil]|uniref:uncharacterized protein LOC109157275 n=1 Tax=Ipomoea nil TaxID=35883 RepID=UPI000900A41E|nr:PREDICTED: uncharacterized protein LOC109157275 [Ipomoea nil]
MAAKALITSGVRRRIGDGKSTLIWEHPWLQDELELMVQTEMPPQLTGAKVVGLIDQNTGTWDPHILDIFHRNDIPRILKIPVSPGYEDIWYWYEDPNGCYSVKNGYRLMVGTYENNTARILYNIWRARNDAVWNACLPRPEKIIATAVASVHAWQQVHSAAPSQSVGLASADLLPLPTEQQAAPTAETQPALPTSPVVAAGMEAVPRMWCFVDAEFRPLLKTATVGAVLFDAYGGYVSAYAAPLQNCLSPLMAETQSFVMAQGTWRTVS